jgi:hypothetical protein
MALHGKGIYLSDLHQFEGGPQAGRASRIAERVMAARMDHAFVWILNQGYNQDATIRETTRAVVRLLKAGGVTVWAWSFPNSAPATASARATAVADIRRAILLVEADGYVLNAEKAFFWEVNAALRPVDPLQVQRRMEQARLFIRDLRLALPELPIGLSSFRFPASNQPNFPWKEFLASSDISLPQVYWWGEEGPGDPATQLNRSLNEFLRPQDRQIGRDASGTGFQMIVGGGTQRIKRNDGGNWWTDGLRPGGRVTLHDAEDEANNQSFDLIDVEAATNGHIRLASEPALTPNSDDTQVRFDYGSYRPAIFLPTGSAHSDNPRWSTRPAADGAPSNPWSPAPDQFDNFLDRAAAVGLAGMNHFNVGIETRQLVRAADALPAVRPFSQRGGITKPAANRLRVAPDPGWQVDQWAGGRAVLVSGRTASYGTVSTNTNAEIVFASELPGSAIDAIELWTRPEAIHSITGFQPLPNTAQHVLTTPGVVGTHVNRVAQVFGIRTQMVRGRPRQGGDGLKRPYSPGGRILGLARYHVWMLPEKGNASGNADATTLTDATKEFPPNYFVGGVVRLKDATETESRRVTANTATSLTWSGAAGIDFTEYVVWPAGVAGAPSAAPAPGATTLDSATPLVPDRWVGGLIMLRGGDSEQFAAVTANTATTITFTPPLTVDGVNAYTLWPEYASGVQDRRPINHLEDTEADWPVDKWRDGLVIVRKANQIVGARRIVRSEQRRVHYDEALITSADDYELFKPMESGDAASYAQDHLMLTAAGGLSAEVWEHAFIALESAAEHVHRVVANTETSITLSAQAALVTADEVQLYQSQWDYLARQVWPIAASTASIAPGAPEPTGANPERRVSIRERTAASVVDDRETERTLWAPLAGVAGRALDFWRIYLGLRRRNADGELVELGEYQRRLLSLIRAVSWASTRHGTNAPGAVQPVRDPLQAGRRAWALWRQVLPFDASADGSPADGFPVERNVTGSRPRVDSRELAAVAPLEKFLAPGGGAVDADFDPRAQFGMLKNPFLGHENAGFGIELSFFWGVLLLLRVTNGHPNLAARSHPVFDCGDCSWPRLVGGGLGYAGAGRDGGFRNRLLENLYVFQPDVPYKIPAATSAASVFAAGGLEYAGRYAAGGENCNCTALARFGGRRPGESLPHRDADLFVARPGPDLVALCDGDVTVNGPELRLQFTWRGDEHWRFVYQPVTGGRAAAGVGRGRIIGQVDRAAPGPLSLRLERVNPTPDMDAVDPVFALQDLAASPPHWSVLRSEDEPCSDCDL